VAFTACWIIANFFVTFANHQVAIGITVGTPDRSYIEYTRMLSLIYQYVINLVVSLSIRRGPDILMFRCGNIVLLTITFFDWANFTILTTLSLLSRRRLTFPVVGLKIFSPLTEFPYGTYENYRNPALIPHKNCLLNHHFSPHLLHAIQNYDITPETYHN